MDNNSVGLLEEENNSIQGEVAQKQEERVVVDTSADPLSATQNSDGESEGKERKLYEKEEVDWKKRYGDMRRYHDSVVGQKQAEIDALREQVDSGRQWSVPKSREELESLKDKDPDLYEAIQTGTKIFAESEINKAKQESIKLKKEAELAKLKFVHPDFDEVKSSDKFKTWISSQPQEIKDWLYKKVDATLAAKALDMFKSDVGLSSNDSKKGTQDTSAADVVKTKQKVEPENKDEHIYTRQEIDKMPADYFEKVKDIIESQWRRGMIK